MLRLICTDGSMSTGATTLEHGASYKVGRSSNCTLAINDLSVSRAHAEVIPAEDVVVIKDLGSSNGTFVDGMRVVEAIARPGQHIRFGNAQFQLVDGNGVDNKEDIQSEVSTYILPSTPPPADATQLSEGQKRVLDMLLKGKSEKEAARLLHLSPHTVHNHVKEIYKRMRVNSRPELLALFVADSKQA